MRMPKKQFFLFFLSSTIIFLIFFLFFKSFESEIRSLSTNQKEFSELSCNTKDLSGVPDYNDAIAWFEGRQINVPYIAFGESVRDEKVLGISGDERYIEVDLSEQKLYAWEGNNLFLETPVSTGLPWWPTPKGEFRIWIKLRSTKMEGGTGKYYYYLPNVPYVMYFENDKVPGWKGYGLHGTYWHNDFGRPRSHGCVNLPTPVAEKLFYWTSPVLPQGKTAVRASKDSPGTRIIIHD